MKGSKSNSSASGCNGGDNTNSNISQCNKHKSFQPRGDKVKDNQGERSNNNKSSLNCSTNTNNSDSNSRKGINHQQKSSGPTICNICAQNVPGPEREEIFAFSKCDHYVCYVCSARLRVICDQNECPICREKLEVVVFRSDKNVAFGKCNLNSYIYDEKHKIYFENESIKRTFEKLLKFRCLECIKKSPDSDKQQQHPQPAQEACNSSGAVNSKKNANNDSEQNRHGQQKFNKRSTNGKIVEFDDVIDLRQHLYRAHNLRLCELCLTHNKLFPFEYSYYSPASLKDHIKSGEQNTSHRGHPECKLCHETFFNKDELIQHMSREHFHCHLCDRHDSILSIYFLDYNSLRQHFDSEHYLCERGNCRHEQFTSAFDTDFEYQLHLVQVHGGSSAGLSRGGERQQRTITLDSSLNRDPQISRSIIPRNAAVVSTGLVATANSSRHDRAQLSESLRAHMRQQQQQQQRLPNRAEFPALGLESSTSTGIETSDFQRHQNNNPSNAQQQFPALASSSTSRANHRVIAGPSSARSFVRTAGGGYRAPTQIDQVDFPPLPEQPKTKSKNKTKPQQQARPRNDAPQTLEELINHTLSVSSQEKRLNKKNGAKGGKNIKQKAIKIQL